MKKTFTLEGYNGEKFILPVIPYLGHIILGEVISKPENLNMGTFHGKTYDEEMEIVKEGSQNHLNKCGTVHCIAGWAVHLAGRQAYLASQVYSSSRIADALFRAAGYGVPNFFTDEINGIKSLKQAVAAYQG